MLCGHGPGWGTPDAPGGGSAPLRDITNDPRHDGPGGHVPPTGADTREGSGMAGKGCFGLARPVPLPQVPTGANSAGAHSHAGCLLSGTFTRTVSPFSEGVMRHARPFRRQAPQLSGSLPRGCQQTAMTWLGPMSQRGGTRWQAAESEPRRSPGITCRAETQGSPGPGGVWRQRARLSGSRELAGWLRATC